MTDPKKVLSYKPDPVPVSYNKRDLILYALGVGASEPKFVYEGDSTFSALPTYSTVLPFKGTSSDIVIFGASFSAMPGIQINPAMVVHGEQETEVLSHPIPLEGEFINQTKPVAIYDKGSGALLVQETITLDPKTRTPLFRNLQSTFIRGAGGFGGDRGSAASNDGAPPNRPPDKVSEEKTQPNQAILYRLSGDYNPLHADPSFAQSVGFPGTILHGLCSYGFAARVVLREWCDNEVERFKSIKARFASPFFPGETFVTKMWKVSDEQIVFEVSSKERNKVVISNAVCRIRGAQKAIASNPSPSTLKCSPVFDALEKAIKTDPNLASQVKAIYRFNIKGSDNSVHHFTLNLKNGSGSLIRGPSDLEPDCVFSVSDDDYLAISNGSLNAQSAVLNGKMKVQGNFALAQKLSLLQKAASKL